MIFVAVLVLKMMSFEEMFTADSQQIKINLWNLTLKPIEYCNYTAHYALLSPLKPILFFSVLTIKLK